MGESSAASTSLTLESAKIGFFAGCRYTGEACPACLTVLGTVAGLGAAAGLGDATGLGWAVAAAAARVAGRLATVFAAATFPPGDAAPPRACGVPARDAPLAAVVAVTFGGGAAFGGTAAGARFEGPWGAALAAAADTGG